MFAGCGCAQEETVGGSVEEAILEADLGASREGSRTGELTIHRYLILYISNLQR